MDQLNSFDSFFVSAESRRTPGHIAHIRIYDPSTSTQPVVRFKDILRQFEERLHVSPLFRKQLVKAPLDLDNPYWIESPDFNLEYHVRHIALPKPGDWRQLCILISRLHGQAINLSLPLWEAYVIEGLDNVEGMPEGAFAIMIKMHHSIVDGRAADAMLEAIHDTEAEPARKPTSNHWRPDPIPSNIELVGNTLANLAKQPFRTSKNLRRVWARQRRQRDFSEKYPDYGKGPEETCVFNGAVSSARVFGAEIFDLDDLKLIKNAVAGATINDVVLLITSFSVEKYLTHHGKMISSPLCSGFTMDTKNISEFKDGVNFATGLFMPVHNDIADPVERLAAIHEETEICKEYAHSVAPDGMRDITMLAPAPMMAWGAKMAIRFELLANTATQHYLITNVPGPRDPRYLAGAKALCSFGLAPVLDGLGLVHMASSYCDKISISFQSCRNMMPDPEFYSECIKHAFEKALESARPLSQRV